MSDAEMNRSVGSRHVRTGAKTFRELRIFTDGGARGNPGPAGVGVAMYSADGKLVKTHKAFLGVKTNNQAEYQAVMDALGIAQNLGAEEISFFADSKLIVEQLSGRWRVKNFILGSMFVKIWNLMQKFEKVSFHHIPREKNTVADKLANEAMDEGMNGAVRHSTPSVI